MQRVVESEAAELKNSVHEAYLPALLSRLGKEEGDIRRDKKGEAWKVAIARYLRDYLLTPKKLWRTDAQPALVSPVNPGHGRVRRKTTFGSLGRGNLPWAPGRRSPTGQALLCLNSMGRAGKPSSQYGWHAKRCPNTGKSMVFPSGLLILLRGSGLHSKITGCRDRL